MPASPLPNTAVEDVWGNILNEAIRTRTTPEYIEENLPERLTPTALSATIAEQIADAPRSDPLAFTGAMAKFRAALTNAKTQPVVIVFVGSSTTAGSQLVPALRWVNIVGGAATPNPTLTLAQAVATPPTAPGVHFVNAGISGANTGSYFTSTTTPQIIGLNPALIVHMIGSNDFVSATPPITAKNSIKYHLNLLEPQLPKTAHLFIHSFERYDQPSYAFPWTEYRDMLESLANESPDLRAFYDASRPFYKIGIPSTDPFGLMEADKIHLNAKGNVFLADVMGAALALPKYTVPPSQLIPIATDYFKKADGPLTRTTMGGFEWVQAQGVFSTVGNKAVATTLQYGSTARAVIETGVSDVKVEVIAGQINSGVAARYNTAGQGYVFIFSGSAGKYRISRQVAEATFEQVVLSSGNSPVAGDVLSLECRGSTLIGRVNGDIVCSAVDTNYTGTLHGMLSLNTTSVMDNFKFYDLT